MTIRRLASSLLVLALLVSACNTDPNVAKKRYVASGNKYFEKKKYREALIMYRNALKKDLKYGEAYYRSALAELALNRPLDAARDLHRAVELQVDNIDAYTSLINIYLNAYLSDRRRPKAYVTELRSLADRLEKRHPQSYEYARVNGYVSLMDGKVKDAINWFEKANAIKPYQPDLMLIYMQSLSSDGRSADAEKIGLDALKRDPKVLSIYDALFLEYLRQKRVPDAENILKQKVANNPNIPEVHMQLAAHYFSQQRRQEMSAELSKLTADTKTFPLAYEQVGDFYLRIRDVDQAIANYSEGAKAFPKDKAKYQKRIIESLILQDKKQEAVAVLNELLKENPKDDEAVAIRASLNMLNGSREQLQSSINDLQAVVSRMPDNPVLRFNLGRAQLAKGNVQQARIQFEEAIKLRPDYILPKLALAQILQQQGEFGRVVQISEEVLSYDQNNVAARLLRTRALIGMGESKQARQELLETSAKNPNVWEAKLQLAALDLAEQRYKPAEETFKAMYAATGDPRALMGLTETYTVQQNYDQAMKVLRAELQKKPDRVDYQVALGNIAVRAKKYDEAIGYFKGALERSPRSADVWIRLGETNRLKGDTKAAKEGFNKAKELAPTNVIPYVQLALLYDTEGQKEQARPLYEQILKLQPDHPIALNNLAFMLAESGTDLDQALTMAQRAKQKMPQDDNVADTLGWIYIRKNLSDSAIGIFRELVRKDPERAVYRYHLAMALAQKGDKASAKKELETALRSKPNKDEETKIRELMAKVS